MTLKRTTLYIITTPWRKDLETSPGVNGSHLYTITALDGAKQVYCPVPCRWTRHTCMEAPSIQTGPTRKQLRCHQRSSSADGRGESDIAAAHGRPGPWLNKFNMSDCQTGFSYLTNAKREDKDRQYLTTAPSLPPSTKWTQTEHQPSWRTYDLALPMYWFLRNTQYSLNASRSRFKKNLKT